MSLVHDSLITKDSKGCRIHPSISGTMGGMERPDRGGNSWLKAKSDLVAVMGLDPQAHRQTAWGKTTMIPAKGLTLNAPSSAPSRPTAGTASGWSSRCLCSATGVTRAKSQVLTPVSLSIKQ